MSGYGQPGPSSGSKTTGKDSKAKQVQQEVDAVVGIMQDNIAKVVKRGEDLEALEDKTSMILDPFIKIK